MARLQRISPFLVIAFMLLLGGIATFIADARDDQAAAATATVQFSAPTADTYSFGGAESSAVFSSGAPY
jgi:hypothetical protein